MKPTAFFINCARGELVDEAALVQAVKEERVAGAFTDVFCQEPPAPDNPLLALEHVSAPPPHGIQYGGVYAAYGRPGSLPDP